MYMRKLLVVIGGLIVIGAIIGVLFLRPKTPESGAREAANKFLTSIKSKDSTLSYSLFSAAFKKRVSANAWSDYLKNEGDYSNIKYVGIRPVTNPSKAYPQVSNPQILSYDVSVGVQQYTYSIVAVQEQKVWKINEYDRFVK